jgi:hypothetical protein
MWFKRCGYTIILDFRLAIIDDIRLGILPTVVSLLATGIIK